jgi:hypothetical protein
LELLDCFPYNGSTTEFSSLLRSLGRDKAAGYTTPTVTCVLGPGAMLKPNHVAALRALLGDDAVTTQKSATHGGALRDYMGSS